MDAVGTIPGSMMKEKRRMRTAVAAASHFNQRHLDFVGKATLRGWQAITFPASRSRATVGALKRKLRRTSSIVSRSSGGWESAVGLRRCRQDQACDIEQ